MTNQLKGHHLPSVLQIKRFPSLHLRWLCSVESVHPLLLAIPVNGALAARERTLTGSEFLSLSFEGHFPFYLCLPNSFGLNDRKLCITKRTCYMGPTLRNNSHVLDWMPISSSSALRPRFNP